MPYDDVIVWVYLVTNSNNGKRYVGITTLGVQERWKGHLRAAEKGAELRLSRAIRKHGVDAFALSVLQECTDVEALKLAEQRWIAELGTFVNGYNMTLGGDGTWGHICSPETRAQMSRSASVKHVSDKARHNMSLAQRRRFDDPVMLEKHRQSIAACDKSYAATLEYKNKIRAVHLGRKRPAGTGEKISASLKAKGMRRTDAQKHIISEKLMGNTCAKRCPIVQLDEQGNVLAIHETTRVAARSIGKVSPGTIIACCKGRIAAAHGYFWRYAREGEQSPPERVEV